jgi:hypothetical protein
VNRRAFTDPKCLEEERAHLFGRCLARGSWLFFPPWSPGSSLLGSDLGESRVNSLVTSAAKGTESLAVTHSDRRPS